jgi:hypothetical protein
MRSISSRGCSVGLARLKCNLLLRAGTETWSLKPTKPEHRKRKKRDATMRVGAGGVELVKRGASRYDSERRRALEGVEWLQPLD